MKLVCTTFKPIGGRKHSKKTLSVEYRRREGMKPHIWTAFAIEAFSDS